jgi:hypothetical protein
MAYRRFCIVLLATAAALLGAGAALVTIVDPYAVDLRQRKKYNRVTDVNLERKVKFELYGRGATEFELVLFGSSRATVLPVDRFDGRAYNYSFSAARLDEVRTVVEHWLSDRVRHVCVGVDFEMFTNFGKGVEFFRDPSYFDRFEVRYSVQGLRDALEELLGFGTEVQRFDANGNKTYEDFRPTNRRAVAGFLQGRQYALREGVYDGDEGAAADLNEIVAVCRRRGFRLTLFVNPVTKQLRDWYRAHVPDGGYARFRETVRSLGAEPDIEVFDFDYDNVVTTDLTHFVDAQHFSRQVGEWMIGFMTRGERHGDFGRFLR